MNIHNLNHFVDFIERYGPTEGYDCDAFEDMMVRQTQGSCNKTLPEDLFVHEWSFGKHPLSNSFVA